MVLMYQLINICVSKYIVELNYFLFEQDLFSCYFCFIDFCKDIYFLNYFSFNGIYIVYNKDNKFFKVYCEFYDKFGYIYIFRYVGVEVNIDDFLIFKKYVKV